MKRFFILAIFIICLCVPLYVKADMDAPSVKEYSATISNPEGAVTYSYEVNGLVKKGVLAFGTTITVQYEEEEDGVLYANAHTQGNDSYALVKVEDIAIIKDGKIEIDYDLKKEGTVLANEGVEVYTGPAYAYEKTGTTLPKDADVVLYGIKDAGEAWMYVEYNGVKGFVCVLDGVIGFDKVEKGIMTFDVTKVYEKPSDRSEESAYKEIIPRNVYIEDVCTIDPWSQSYYIEYNGIKGYVGSYDVATTEYSVCRYNLNTISIYENVSFTGEPLYTGDVDEDDIVLIDYSVDRRDPEVGYLTYKGVSGWVKLSEEVQKNGMYEHNNFYSYDFPSKVINEEGCNYYKAEYDNNGDISNMTYVGNVAYGKNVMVNTFPSDEKWQGKIYRMINIGDEEYAIDENDIEIPEELTKKETESKNLIEVTEPMYDISMPGLSNEETNAGGDIISFSSRQIVVICVAIGIVFLLMFVVIIALANKKTSNVEKNDDLKK